MAWLERTPWWILGVAALLLGITPLGQPHLLEKWGMLVTGTLRRPLDWFDFFLHGAPLLLIAVKTLLAVRKR